MALKTSFSVKPDRVGDCTLSVVSVACETRSVANYGCLLRSKDAEVTANKLRIVLRVRCHVVRHCRATETRPFIKHSITDLILPNARAVFTEHCPVVLCFGSFRGWSTYSHPIAFNS